MTATPVQCPSCAAIVSAGSRFCSSCGEVVGGLSQLKTAMEADARHISSDSIPAGGFTPGSVLIGRYRIIGLLGRGGMGEVYRADDLKLGQPVALKFLPKALAADPVRRERFFAEVRITRQLAHPNICRVYDIAEVDGQHFLSMEYIDGEDLASLIKRIGYLSNEKALDIARQLAAGLAAAHEKGVLHRDLKPANIMIDGHGRVRITDFGLAIAAAEETMEAAEILGTPAYMAPEQFAGKGASVRSDIYAVGLILYEIYSGRRAFTANSIADLRAQKEGHTPTAPSEIRDGVDPLVERLITRCMDRDPRARPASAAQLAGTLPGGDPLAAALAAGETPSPEMVAASGSKEGLHPVVAMSLLAFVLLGALGVVALKDRTDLFQRLPAEKSPELLSERARELLRKTGYPDAAADHAWGYWMAFSPLTRNNPELADVPDRFMKLGALSMRFWYRKSPRPLEHLLGEVSLTDPTMLVSGEARVQLDTEGRLRQFLAVPTPQDAADAAATAPDWTLLFTEAGFDQSQFMQVEPQWTPPFYADVRAAWQGVLPDVPQIPIRIEAAAHRGKPVYFDIIGPWHRPAETRTPTDLYATLLGIGALAAAIFFVRRNLRSGRGDRRGAFRVAGWTLALLGGAWVLQEHHVFAVSEAALLFRFLESALVLSGANWLLYLALEPVVRRRWPQSLVTWTRLLSGEWRDPLVGRDVLAGCALGVTVVGLIRLQQIVVAPTGAFIGIPLGISGAGSSVAAILARTPVAFSLALGAMVLFFFLRRALRRDWIVVSTLLLSITMIARTTGAPWSVAFTVGAVALTILVLIPMRFGLLTTMTGTFILGFLNTRAITLDTTAWYFRSGIANLLFVVALSFAAFRVSLGSRPLLDGGGED